MKTKLRMGALLVVAGWLGLAAAPIDLGHDPAPGTPLDAIEQLNSSSFLEDGRAKELAESVEKKDLPEAAQRAFRLRDDAIRKTMLCAVVGYWGEIDPVPAAQFVETVAEERLLRSLTARLFYHWPLKDAATAAARAKDYEEGSLIKREALSKLTRRMAATDPQAALDTLLASGNLKSRNPAIYYIFEVWAGKDLPAAVAAAEKLTEPEERNAASFEIARSWGCKDPDAALRWASSLPAGLRDRITGHVLGSMACTDPVKAAAFVPNLPPSESRFVIPIVSTWAARDPAAAKTWVLGLPASPFRVDGLNALLASLTATNLQDGIDLAMSLTNGAERAESIRQVVLWWATADWQSTVNGVRQPGLADFPAAKAWAQSLTNDADRIAAVHGLSQPWKREDPAGMMDYIASLPAGKERDQLMTSQVHYWSEGRPENRVAALDWTFGQTSPDVAGKCLGQLLYASRGADVKEVGARVAQLPPGEVKNVTAAHVYRAWKRQDEAAALQWLDGLGLPAEVKEPIVNPPRKKKK